MRQILAERMDEEERENLITENSGGDAPRGHTRTHPEHDGKDLSGRWYFAGDGAGEQVAARLKWGRSSVGRAPALQAGGQEFESLRLHSS